MLEVRKVSLSEAMSSVWAKCLKCNGFNHFARKCKVRSRPTQLMQELEPEELLQVKWRKGQMFWCEAGGKRLELTFQLDTAASCNVLSLPDYVQLGSPKLRDSGILLSMYHWSVKSVSSSGERQGRQE